MQSRLAIGYRIRLSSPAWLSWEAERGRFALWLPVFMGTGVLVYYALRFEPPVWLGPVFLVLSAGLAVIGRPWPSSRLLLFPLIAAALGFSSAQVATARAPPLLANLPTRATQVTGVTRAVEALPGGRRVTLEAGRLDDASETLPRQVRIRLRPTDHGVIETGDALRIRALIRMPAPPSYPGAWDLQRDAWYTGLGASGYALGAAEVTARADPTGVARWVQRLRETIAGRVLAVVPGAAGTISVTLLTGASMGIPEADHAAFRDSGLAHLLAVAGLHIGIVMGFAFGLARLGFALSERASLLWPTRKLSGLVALAAGGAYMVLTGMHVPIVRSFTMACLVTVALLSGRRAVSLRGLGLAGVVLMLVEPQQVPEVSFQMSFSAVLALIAGYEALRPLLQRLHGASLGRRLAAHVTALALTSALAGTASMPYGAYHFGHIQIYYVIANMVAVPLTAFWVMPAGLIALPLMPLGLEWLALMPMGWGAEAILWVAHTAADWPAATISVPHMPTWGLIVLSIGIAWLGIWRTPIRLAGLAAIGLGLVSPIWAHPPDLLISDDGRLIAVRTTAGAFFQQTQGGSAFVRDAWLQYWDTRSAGKLPLEGNLADGAVSCTKEVCLLRPRPDARAAMLVRGAAHPAGCADAAVIVSAEPARGLCPRPWPALVDRFTVWRYGATAVWLEPSGAVLLTDRTARGARPWVPPLPTPRPKPAPALPPAEVDTAAGQPASQ
jgi:competence protein ComEC